MKKIIAIVVLIMGIGMSANAQSDSFFSPVYSTYRDGVDEETPRLPGHDLVTNQDAPLGAGLLLLAGMGLGYAALRKKD